MARYEMLWDCGQCGTAGLLGLTHRHCPSCGAAQDPTRRYYPEAGKEVAADAHPYQGKDKLCPACDTPNAAASTFCVACGSPLDGAKEVATRGTQTAASPDAFESDDAKAARAEHAAAKQAAEEAKKAELAARVGVVAPAASSPFPWGKVAMVLAILAPMLCCGLCGIASFWTQTAALTATGASWTRTVQVEAFDLVSDEAWKDELPADATGVSCREAKRSSRTVADGEDCRTVREDLGDGSFSSKEVCTPRTRSEPIYDTKCTYMAPRWHAVDPRVATGADRSPVWPSFTPSGSGGQLGATRESGRTEVFTLSFVDAKGTARSCDVDEARWHQVSEGSRWTADVGVLTGGLDCDTLAPAP